METSAARNLKLSHPGLISANGSVGGTPSPATSSHRSSISTSHGFSLDSNFNNSYNTSAATSPLSFTFQVPAVTPHLALVGSQHVRDSSPSGQQQQQQMGQAVPSQVSVGGLGLGLVSSINSQQKREEVYQQQQQEQREEEEEEKQKQQERLLSPSYSYNLQPDNSKTQGLGNSSSQATGHFYPTECQNFASEQSINRVSLQQQEQQHYHQQDTTPSCGIFKPFKHASLLPTTETPDATVYDTTQQNTPFQNTTRHYNPQDQHDDHQQKQNQNYSQKQQQQQQHNCQTHQIIFHHHQNQGSQPTSDYYNNSPAAPGGFLQLTPEDQYLEASRAAVSSLYNYNNNTYSNNNNNYITTDYYNSSSPSSTLPKMPLVVQPQPSLSSLLLPPLALNPVFHHHYQPQQQQQQQQHQQQQAIHYQQLPPLPPRQRKTIVTYQRLTRANVAAIDSKDSRQARWHRVLSYVAQVRSSYAQGEVSGSNTPTSAWISHQERIVRSTPDEDLIDPMMDPLWATQTLKRRRSLWDGGSCGTDGVDQFVWDDELDSGGNRFTLPPRSQQGDANENGVVGGEFPVVLPLEECPTSSSTGSRRRAMEVDQDGDSDRPSKRARSSEGLSINNSNNNTSTMKVSNANISKTHALALEQYLETLRTIEKSRLPLMKRAIDMDFDYSLGTTDSWRQVYVA